MATVGLESLMFDWNAMLPQIFLILTFVVILIFFVVVGGWFIFYLSHPYKLTYWEVIGSGDQKRPYTVDRPKNNRFKVGRKGWKAMYPILGKNNYFQAFDEKFIYPGKNVYAVKVKDEYFPVAIEISKTTDVIASFNLIPQYLRNYQSQKIREIDQEFSKDNFWDTNKYIIIAVVTVLACLATAIVTIWLSYRIASPQTAQLARLADVLQTVGQQVV